MALVVKNLSPNAGDIRDAGSMAGSGRSPGGGHSNPLQHSCPEDPKDRGAWWAPVHGVAKSQTRLSTCTSCRPSASTNPSVSSALWPSTSRLPVVCNHRLASVLFGFHLPHVFPPLPPQANGHVSLFLIRHSPAAFSDGRAWVP